MASFTNQNEVFNPILHLCGNVRILCKDILHPSYWIEKKIDGRRDKQTEKQGESLGVKTDRQTDRER